MACFAGVGNNAGVEGNMPKDWKPSKLEELIEDWLGPLVIVALVVWCVVHALHLAL